MFPNFFQIFSELFDPKTRFFDSNTGFFDPKTGKLFSKLFLPNFCELEKTVISEKFPNFKKETFPRLAKMKSSEISV